jgi:hypothetical protein
METLHTPGDWYATQGQIVSQDTGKTLALIPYYDESNEEQTANANLMASAPKLLDALKEALDQLQSWNPESEPTFTMRRVEEAIQQAINP